MQQNGVGSGLNHTNCALGNTILPVTAYATECKVLILLVAWHFKSVRGVYSIVCVNTFYSDIVFGSVGFKFLL
jgi:hypothetical protein